ncbi:hypothetical protein DPMN_093969 [Dreissena polymorpha]|uniref:HAT C-terminal dimerisation domain-containing protein n=1 Tax=Dreissena polymorpha TaxID=45954 RepID=A0A9D4L6J1_DREPO|nr:hypothetical protein DPMN_093969 [Dreissena polymorpha]
MHTSRIYTVIQYKAFNKASFMCYRQTTAKMSRQRGTLASYNMKDFKELTRVFLRCYKKEYPLISQLMNIALCIPMSSVVCECGLSLQNRINVKSRTALIPANVDTLMKLAMGPNVLDFLYEQAIRHWKAEKKRRLARLYEPPEGN